MKKQAIIFSLAAILIINSSLNAQDSKKYKEMSAEIEQSIWGVKDPMFDITTIPTEYKNESAVVLAQKHTIATDSKRKTGFLGLPTRNFIDRKVWRIFRQKVAINDQNSLNDFSEITFAKLDLKRRIGAFKNTFTAFTFLNIQIQKPDGSIQKVNIDESAVTLKETKGGKKNKIAIPNLAIGDIVDYYIASYEEAGTILLNKFNYPDVLTFILSDEYPIVKMGINIVLDKRVAAEYQSINNAPEFKVTQKDEDNILELTANNLPKSKSVIWASALKQIPVARVMYSFGSLNANEFIVEPGEVKKSKNSVKRVEDQVQQIIIDGYSTIYYYDPVVNLVNSHFSSIRKMKNGDGIPAKMLDSLIVRAFYLCRFYTFYTSLFTLKDNMMDADRDLEQGGQYTQAMRMSAILDYNFGTKSDFLDIANRNSVVRKNAFEVSDLSMFLQTGSPKTKNIYLANSLYNFGEVPTSIEATDGNFFSVSFEKSKTEMDRRGNRKIAALTKENHSQETKLSINLDPTDNQSLIFTREVKAKGQLRRHLQASLLMPEDVVKDERTYLGLTTDLIDDYKKIGKAQAKNYEELVTIFKKARDTEKEKFEDELYEELDQKIKELKSFKLINRGLHHTNDVFHMTQDFSVTAWVKKAGNNFIVEVGKFVGGQFEVKADQRERVFDIYMPHARTYSYAIDFTIPKGYTVAGIEKLNKKVENECGGFISTAEIVGDTLKVSTKKYYTNIEEKAANWPKLTAFIDAAFEFTKEKILLKKN